MVAPIRRRGESPVPERENEAGQALILALFVLLLTAVAASLIGLGLAVEVRTQTDDLERAQSSFLLDAALADALARRHSQPGFTGREEQLGIGRFASRILTISPTELEVEVEAVFRRSQRRAVCTVEVGPDRKLRVREWRPLGPGGDLP